MFITNTKRNGPWSEWWTWKSPERKIRFWDFLGSLAEARRTSEQKESTRAMITVSIQISVAGQFPVTGISAAGRMIWRAARPQSVADVATVKF